MKNQQPKNEKKSKKNMGKLLKGLTVMSAALTVSAVVNSYTDIPDPRNGTDPRCDITGCYPQ